MTKLGNKSRMVEENRYANAKKHILNKGISYLAFLGIVAEDANVFGEDGKSMNVSDFREGLDLLQLFNRQTFPSYKFFEE